MTDNEPRKRSQYSRRNPAFSPRPPPGVQKALQNFGVPDLRQLLDKKHQEQRPGEATSPNQKAKLPPPDPQYNYLKDPSREVTNETSPSKHEEHKKPLEKKRQPLRHGPGPKFEQTGRNSDQQNNNIGSRTHSKDKGTPSVEVKGNSETLKKELRFSDIVTNLDGEPTKEKEHTTKQRQGSFKGRKNASSQAKEMHENPINIKVKLSLETGHRSCELDENTIIPDIKHVPDQKPYKGGFRGGRGGFRGRGRGRGSFRGRRDYKKPAQNSEGSQDTAASNQGVTQEEGSPQDDHDEEEYVDTNENYEESNNEYDGISVKVSQDSRPFKENLTKCITITSSNFQDGEVQRDVLVNPVEQGTNEPEEAKV